MKTNNNEQVHRLAGLLLYDLELPDTVRHPVRFFFVDDILHAAGESPDPLAAVVTETQPLFRHKTPTCDCRFCATGLFATRILKRLP